MRTLFLLSVTSFLLVACAAAQVKSQLNDGFEKEANAWAYTQSEYNMKCPHRTSNNPLPASKALEAAECYEKIARVNVLPVVVDPIAFNDLMITYKRIGLNRKKELISADEASLSTQEAWNNYIKVVSSKAENLLQKAQMQDQITLERMNNYSQSQSISERKCSSISIAPIASVGCKNICINGTWSEVCG